MKLEQAYAALRFDPAVPWWVIGALAVLCLLALLPALLRRARGVVWRVLAFAVLLAWLAGPRLVQETRDTLPDIGLFVIDKTDSMRVAAAGGAAGPGASSARRAGAGHAGPRDADSGRAGVRA